MFSSPVPPLPSRTVQEFARKRPRSREIDAAIHFAEQGGRLYFKVGTVLNHGGPHSVVLVGCLQWRDDTGDHHTEKLCLKLVDSNVSTQSKYRNQLVHFLRNELIVYTRMKDFQGTFMPHEYGFHNVSLTRSHIPSAAQRLTRTTTVRDSQSKWPGPEAYCLRIPHGESSWRRAQREDL